MIELAVKFQDIGRPVHSVSLLTGSLFSCMGECCVAHGYTSGSCWEERKTAGPLMHNFILAQHVSD
jgi:hypothetical protein